MLVIQIKGREKVKTNKQESYLYNHLSPSGLCVHLNPSHVKCHYIPQSYEVWTCFCSLILLSPTAPQLCWSDRDRSFQEGTLNVRRLGFLWNLDKVFKYVVEIDWSLWKHVLKLVADASLHVLLHPILIKKKKKSNRKVWQVNMRGKIYFLIQNTCS